MCMLCIDTPKIIDPKQWLDLTWEQLLEIRCCPNSGQHTSNAQVNIRDGQKMQGYPDNNPKSRFGVKKPPLALIPDTGLLHEAMAFKDGAIKYGPYNWREPGREVSVMVYLNAAKRHIAQFQDRENYDQKSLVHHLGHARACLNIVIDAMACDNAIDDRPPHVGLSAILDALTED